ncbi:site-2 protease family protein [Patescibacteria group bacterium]
MLIGLVLLIVGFLLSLSVHEAAHAYVSDRLGDPTARLSNRVTLNPLAHLDPIGTLLPIFLIITGSPIIFGWGKPVPFDPFNLRNPRRDTALISLSGPLANLAMATFLSISIRLFHSFSTQIGLNLEYLLTPIIALNIMWAIFNLIPVHPLDGGKVLIGLLPKESAYKVDEVLNRFGYILILFLLLPIFGRSPLMIIASPVINFFLSILLPATPLV